jgi:hypothetical protein
VVVSFRLVGETDDEGEDIYLTSTSTWNYTDSIVEDSTETITHNTYEVDVTFNNEDRATGEEREITEAMVYDANGDEFTFATVTIVGNVVTVEGLSAGSDYSVELVTDDAFTDVYVVSNNLTFGFTTDALVDEVTETISFTGATFDFTLLDDASETARTVATAQVFDMSGTEITTVVLAADLVTVTALAPNTTYELYIESNDGIGQYMTFTTEKLLSVKDVTVGETTANVALTVDEFDPARTIKTVVVKDDSGTVVQTMDLSTFTFTSLVFDLTGLTADSAYTIEVTTNDDITIVIEFTTDEVAVTE